MPRPCSGCALPLAIKQSALSPRAVDPYDTDSTPYTACVLGGYLAIHSAYAMGRLDQSCGYYSNYCIFRCHMCNAQNACEQEGKEKANCRERRDEWRKLLRQPKFDSRDEYRSYASSNKHWHSDVDDRLVATTSRKSTSDGQSRAVLHV